MNETRTDVHRPGSPDFDPEAYDCWGVFDLNPDYPNPAAAIRRRELVNKLIDSGYRLGAHGSGQCGHCGTYIRYAALMVREDVKQYIWVGETCLDNRFTLTKGEFDALRRQAKLDREAQARKAAFAALCEQYPALAYATYAENLEVGIERSLSDLDGQQVVGYREQQYLGTTPEDHRIASGTGYATSTMADIARKARRYGEVSERQAQFVEKLVGEVETKLAAYRTKLTERDNAPEVPALSAGRQVLEGEVLTLKEQEGYLPGQTTLKMLVKLDSGQRVWGTVPSAIYVKIDKHDRVRFTATVKPKDGEPGFGYFSRPTNAEVVSPFVTAA